MDEEGQVCLTSLSFDGEEFIDDYNFQDPEKIKGLMKCHRKIEAVFTLDRIKIFEDGVHGLTIHKQ